jgi:hypothetical protein
VSDRVPDWPAGTVAILATTGDGPHAMPVSAAVRTGDRTVHVALGRRRETLVRLRADPRCTLTVLAGPDLAFTLHGRATVVDEDVEGTVGLRMDVAEVHDHLQPTFTITAGVDWHWTDESAAARDEAIRAALHRFGG